MENKFCEKDLNVFKDFADWLLTLSPTEFTTIGVIVGYLLSFNLTYTQTNIVGNWLELVGQIVLTFNAQMSVNTPPSENDYYNLIKEINKLKREIDELKKRNQ